MLALLITAGLAFLVSCLATRALLGLLRRGAVIDHPNERSSHESPTPRGAGLAVVATVVVAALAWDVAENLNSESLGLVLGLAMGLGALSFVVLLQARPRDLLVILVASEAAVLGWEAGGHLPPLGPALVGALAVGLVANLQARHRGVPSAVAMVPGMLLLVPGSVGFRAVEAFASNDAVAGVNAAFTCVQTAAALVSGLLLANALVRAR